MRHPKKGSPQQPSLSLFLSSPSLSPLRCKLFGSKDGRRRARSYGSKPPGLRSSAPCPRSSVWGRAGTAAGGCERAIGGTPARTRAGLPQPLGPRSGDPSAGSGRTGPRARHSTDSRHSRPRLAEHPLPSSPSSIFGVQALAWPGPVLASCTTDLAWPPRPGSTAPSAGSAA